MEQMIREIFSKKGPQYTFRHIDEIFKYIWFIGDLNGIDSYLEECSYHITYYTDRRQFQYIIDVLKKRLNTNSELDVLRYMYKKSGYLIHSTRECMYESIKEKGLDGSIKLFNIEELNKISTMFMVKYNCDFDPVGWLMKDIYAKKGNHWFYDKTAINAVNYSNGPEWFNTLCGNTYADTKEEQEALKYRDKDCARNNIIKICNRLNFSTKDLEYVLSIFEKYWNIFANSKQLMLIINQRDVETLPLFDDLLDQYDDIDDLKEIIYKLIFEYEVNKSTNKIIPVDKITKIDLSPYFISKKIKQTEAKKQIHGEIEYYCYFDFVCSILKEYLLQYATYIKNNIKQFSTNEFVIMLDYSKTLISVANDIRNNIVYNSDIGDEAANYTYDMKYAVIHLLKCLGIDIKALTEIIFYTYKAMMNKNNDNLLIEFNIDKINSTIEFTEDSYIDCSHTIINNRRIEGIYIIEIKRIIEIINQYIKTDNYEKIFIELYTVFTKFRVSKDDNELTEFDKEINELKKRVLHN